MSSRGIRLDFMMYAHIYGESYITHKNPLEVREAYETLHSNIAKVDLGYLTIYPKFYRQTGREYYDTAGIKLSVIHKIRKVYVKANKLVKDRDIDSPFDVFMDISVLADKKGMHVPVGVMMSRFYHHPLRDSRYLSHCKTWLHSKGKLLGGVRLESTVLTAQYQRAITTALHTALIVPCSLDTAKCWVLRDETGGYTQVHSHLQYRTPQLLRT